MNETLRAIWCRLAAHSGRETIFSLDENEQTGVKTIRLARQTCLKCGRRIS